MCAVPRARQARAHEQSASLRPCAVARLVCVSPLGALHAPGLPEASGGNRRTPTPRRGRDAPRSEAGEGGASPPTEIPMCDTMFRPSEDELRDNHQQTVDRLSHVDERPAYGEDGWYGAFVTDRDCPNCEIGKQVKSNSSSTPDDVTSKRCSARCGWSSGGVSR
jgi:hypothetical protein